MSDLQATAIHEAGHAVIGRVLGLTCGGASIVADESEGELGHGIIADPWRTAWDWDQRGRYRDSSLAFRGRIYAYMAGAEAERELLGRRAIGDGDDRDQIALMLESGEPGIAADQWVKREPRMRAVTRGLIRRHRAKIERLAAELQRHQTMTGEEIDAVLG
jgi:ATP-dependent Zn protease